MNKYIVWFEDEYFDEIMNKGRNLKFGDTARDAAESYVNLENEEDLLSIIYVVNVEKIKHVIDQIKNDGFFTKEMEDEVFLNSEKFYRGYSQWSLSNLK